MSFPELPKLQAYGQGVKAHKNGFDLFYNPYPAGTALSKNWREGWEDQEYLRINTDDILKQAFSGRGNNAGKNIQ